ncbi:MAG: cytochrome c3 family protein [Deltaproteobacteria bacterium]
MAPVLCVIFVFCCLSGCAVDPSGPAFDRKGCRACHPVILDPAHDIGCVNCHSGRPEAQEKAVAHEGLVPRPAHPSSMDAVCGRCHAAETARAKTSPHFTMSGMISAVWRAFFPGETMDLSRLPSDAPHSSPEALVGDLLRRRCLLCHIAVSGDGYSGTQRGTGCAACHTVLAKDPRDHRFRKGVPDDRCLACHYGNFVGWDYYGRFEKDFEEDFRAPLVRGDLPDRPYGVEWHEMTPDVHRTAGLSCSNCHPGGPCTDERAVSCLECHEGSTQRVSHPGPLLDLSRVGHRQEDREHVDCAVCHAVWSFQDRGRSLVRQDDPFWGEWVYLAVQGSREVELAVEKAVRCKDPSAAGYMLDRLTGEARPGIWFQLFEERRSWPVPFAEDLQGRLRVTRPLLDLHLSYIDADGRAIFDGLSPAPDARSIPYTPHTVGKADHFRTLAVAKRLMGRSENRDHR